MKQWIADLFTNMKKDRPVALFERNGLKACVSAQPRSCGHTGHHVELMLYFPSEEKWHSIGLVGDTALQDTIILLQVVQEFVGHASGVRELPTVRMQGTTYFFDVLLGEFRKVDNPLDRIVTERTE